MECNHGTQERSKEQYFPANIEIWIKNVNLEYGTSVKSVCCRNGLPERDMSWWIGEKNKSISGRYAMATYEN